MNKQTATVDGLMACPFCGGKADVHWNFGAEWVECEECGVEMGADRIAEAVTAWNRRASAAVQAEPTVIQGVLAEVTRATKKFPTWPTDPLHALAVLGEEFGELTKDMLQLTYEPHKTSAEQVRTEAIQTAAMALRLVMSLEQYRYAPCEQHKQQAAPSAPADPVQRPGDHVPGGQA